MGAVFNRVTLSATGDTLLAVAGTNAGDAGWQLTFAGSSWTGSIVLKQNTAPPGATASLSTVSYFNATTGALVAAGTAITADGSFIVANTGLDLYAVYTHTAGTVQITLMAAGGQYGGISVAAADITAGTFGAFTGSTGTYAFPAALTIAGALSGVTTLAASGVVTLTNATEATTGPAGALVLTGGLYVAKKVFSIGDLTVGASTFVVTAATGAVSAGSALFAGADSGVNLIVRDTGAYSAGVNGAALRLQGLDSTSTNANLAIFYSLAKASQQADLSVAIGLTGSVIEVARWVGGASAAATTLNLYGPLAITGALTGATSVISASPTGGLGYGTGAGGAETQTTNKQTGVTSNTITTAITMNNEALAADAITAFTFTNSTIAATDTVIVTHESAGTSGAYTCNAFPAAGSAVISVANRTAGALGEAIVLRVTVIKSVSA